MNMTFKNSQLMRYILVGGFAYVTEMAALAFFKKGLNWPDVHAVAVSFWVGFVVAFVLQKYITFQNHEKRPHMLAGQLFFYSLLVAWNYVFTLTCVHLLRDTISVFVIRTGVIAIVTLWNFVIYKQLFKTS